MKRMIFLVVLLLIFLTGKSQYQIEPKIRSYAVLVQFDKGSGSGFYLLDSLNVFFVTAYHVLFDTKTQNLNGDSMLLISYRDDVEKDGQNNIKISLAVALNLGYLKTDAKNDVAVVDLASLKQIDSLGNFILLYKEFVRKMGVGSKINGWPTRDLLALKDVEAGSDIFIIGYPKSLGLQGRFDLDRPLFRKGIVAGKDYNFHRIIGDGAVYFGNSGGMVTALKISENNKAEPRFYIIGLISEFIPFEEYLFDGRGNPRSLDEKNSGYSVIIPTDFISTLLSQFKR